MSSFPHLSILLDAAIQQKVLLITYETRGQQSKREMQPIGNWHLYKKRFMVQPGLLLSTSRYSRVSL